MIRPRIEPSITMLARASANLAGIHLGPMYSCQSDWVKLLRNQPSESDLAICNMGKVQKLRMRGARKREVGQRSVHWSQPSCMTTFICLLVSSATLRLFNPALVHNNDQFVRSVSPELMRFSDVSASLHFLQPANNLSSCPGSLSFPRLGYPSRYLNAIAS
jgi:hypothetical protein